MRIHDLIRGWREGRCARRDPERLAALTEPIDIPEEALLEAQAQQAPEPPPGQPARAPRQMDRVPARPRGLMLVVWVLLLPVSLAWWPAGSALVRHRRQRQAS